MALENIFDEEYDIKDFVEYVGTDKKVLIKTFDNSVIEGKLLGIDIPSNAVLFQPDGAEIVRCNWHKIYFQLNKNNPKFYSIKKK